MNTDITTALIGAAGVGLGSLVTYWGLRLQIREAHRKDKETSQRELGAAELTYLVKIQEMLVDAGQRLMTAEQAHVQKEVILEREKYVAQEELKRVELKHQQAIETLKRLIDDQNEEILRRDRIIAGKDSSILSLQATIERLQI